VSEGVRGRGSNRRSNKEATRSQRSKPELINGEPKWAGLTPYLTNGGLTPLPTM
jgi:hypothetical protein